MREYSKPPFLKPNQTICFLTQSTSLVSQAHPVQDCPTMFGKDYGPGSPSTPPKGGRKRSSPASKDPEVLGSQVPKSGISASPSLAVRTHQPHGSGAVQTRAARPTAPSTTEPGEDLLREAQLRALGLLSAASELRLWPPNSVSAEPVPAMPVAPATPAAPAAFASSIAPGAQNIPSRARQFCGSASQEAGARDLGTAAQPGPHPRGQGPRPLPGVEPRLPALNAFHEPTRGLDIASVTCSADIRALPPPSAPSGTGFPSERKEPGSSHRAPIGHPSRATASGSDKDSHGHTVTGEVSLTKQGIESARKMEIKVSPACCSTHEVSATCTDCGYSVLQLCCQKLNLISTVTDEIIPISVLHRNQHRNQHRLRPRRECIATVRKCAPWCLIY